MVPRRRGAVASSLWTRARRHTQEAELRLAEVIEVRAQWDPEAGVWWAESADLPGLVPEAPTLDALIERASLVIPDPLTAAEGPPGAGSPPRRVTFRVDRVVEAAA